MFLVPSNTSLYKQGIYNKLDYNNEYIRKCTNHYIEIPSIELTKKMIKCIKNCIFKIDNKSYNFSEDLIIDKAIFEYLNIHNSSIKECFIEIKIFNVPEKINNIVEVKTEDIVEVKTVDEVKKQNKKNQNIKSQ